MRRSGLLFFFLALYFTQWAKTGAPEVADNPCMLYPPQNFNAVFTAPATAFFSWDPVPGSIGYRLNIRVDGVQQSPVLILIGNGCSYDFPSGNYFEFSVQAFCETGGEGPCSRRLFLHPPLGPIITVDELVQREHICKTPEVMQLRNANTIETFTIQKPTEGISPVRTFIIEKNSNNSNKPTVFFALWANADDDYLHYEQIAMNSTPDGQLTQLPDGSSDWLSSIVQFYLNNVPFFNFTATAHPDNFQVTLHYQQTVRMATCNAGKGESGDRSDQSMSAVQPGGCYLFPNPVSDQLNIQMNDVPESTVQIRISDLSGRILHHLSYEGQAEFPSQQVAISVAGLAPGLYRLSATAGNWAVQKTFIKTE